MQHIILDECCSMSAGGNCFPCQLSKVIICQCCIYSLFLCPKLPKYYYCFQPNHKFCTASITEVHINIQQKPPLFLLLQTHSGPLCVSSRLYFSDGPIWDVMSYKTPRVPPCPPHIVQWMESSPLRHLLSLMVMETIAHLSQEVVQCASTMALSIGPQSYSHTEGPFSH